MFETILFPTDGSDEAERVLDLAIGLADAHDATLHVLNIADANRTSYAATDSGKTDVLVEEGERIVDEAVDRAREHGVSVIESVIQGVPASTVTEYAERQEVGAIVVPTSGRGAVSRLVLGSVATRVIRTADVPVLSVRPEAAIDYPFGDVLVASDGSATAGAAVERAAVLAAAEGATLHVLSVVEIAAYGPEAHATLTIDTFEERAENAVDAAREVAERHGVQVETYLEYGGVNASLLRGVEESGAELVVLGTHGRTGFDRYLLGSVAERTVRTAPVPVLTVREPPAE